MYNTFQSFRFSENSKNMFRNMFIYTENVTGFHTNIENNNL